MQSTVPTIMPILVSDSSPGVAPPRRVIALGEPSSQGYSPLMRILVASVNELLVPQTVFVPQTDLKPRVTPSPHTAEVVPHTVFWSISVVPQTVLVPHLQLVPHTDFELVTK